MHDDLRLIRFVIPGSTRNPVFFWIPAFAGMTSFAMINVAVYKSFSVCPVVSKSSLPWKGRGAPLYYFSIQVSSGVQNVVFGVPQKPWL